MDVGTVLGLLLVASIVLVIGVAIWELAKWLATSADRRGVPQQLGIGLVIRHEYEPERLIWTGKAMIRRDEIFSLVIRLGRHEETIPVIKPVYQGIADDAWVHLTYQVGKHTGRKYLCDFPGRVVG